MERNRSHAWTVGSLLLAVVLWGAFFFAIAQRQALVDWWKLRGYAPPAAVTAIARADTMTEYASHLFYVNKPELIADRTSFSEQCPVDVEKTIVLGCYLQNDEGIYLFAVQDTRLDGVVEVTAAHEMLHAAYERLAPDEKRQVDDMLQSYYKTGLQDERLRKTFKAYEDSGADITNEMHSIIGTEVKILPAGLETYYKQYFADRQKVIALASRYEAEFTSREVRVAAYDAQLAPLKQSIATDRATLNTMLSELQALESVMNTQKSEGDTAAYNANVRVYNQRVDAYNALLKKTKAEVERYNNLVDERNALASEEQALVQSLSGSTLPSSK